MKKYNHQEIELKWQKRWEESQVFQAQNGGDKKKWYTLVEFPYPSGAGLHVGHVRSYTALDIVSRKKRMEGYNVLYPIGWDAFGLPTENYAIKNKIHPQVATQQNIATFKRQLKALGLSFDWSREVNTTDPAYYKWTQWIFLQFFKKGLAYQKEMPINWCPQCKIGLANEEVVDGKCERCGTESTHKNMKQWMLAITKYADRLIEDLKTVDYLPKIAQQQINWIGKSEGINITYDIEEADEKIEVYTTRPDTNFGATFVVAAPDSDFVTKNLESFPKKEKVEQYVKDTNKKSELERIAEGRKKTGVFTGWSAINNLNGRLMPVYVGDFVLSGVGTGVVVGVPGHDLRDFEFAQAMDLEIIRVVKDSNGDDSEITKPEQVQESAGTMVNSDFLNGMDIHAATEKIKDYMEEKGFGKRIVNFKLRDWIFSRQHYWGEPIPIVHCEKCGAVPVPEDQLPLELPDVKNYEPTDTGESPLAAMTDWVNTKCPVCGAVARRETDTMPNWAGSSWYFLRYCDPKNNAEFASQENLKYFIPVDLYNGGMEHTTLHLLYSRFWHKFLFDCGHVPTSEPYQRRRSHGMVLASDGKKMSKSLGNVVNPDDIIKEYGADTLRLYEMFMGPFDEAIAWDPNAIRGIKKFLVRVYKLATQVTDEKNQELEKIIHQTIKKVTLDIDAMKFNTAVSQLMICVNALEKAKNVLQETFELFLKVLSLFAPHVTEELWENLGHKESIIKEPWPKWDEELVKDEVVKMAVQVNGKVRANIELSVTASAKEAQAMALTRENVLRNTSGKKMVKVIYVPGKIINIVVK
ncbi:MAG: leucine--tRNA ligase [Candidatus Kerfeldbacteria bacterium RIFOXYA2_FULL_38_24]|uniref:Leucine--tRNA ligase n=1 Tax=Candidatus Kerfeldbacteria bacterium RIFOXYB2_FULL_38_14 TaxID=1798547 RepID=A0A1G2BFH0_9BACT|nr:MAG: leucine--tRNA ligase [Candidatus Kerfeldbacteria bacterium RIFOXYA2_FULL_38_24]OGY86947.1 MAG: leucine--tRNA ligase [Candidatus Kerfeldbacteria bacterium RIFOXYB2_FULL_38_14]OGY88917.1 MAG: leucine--tRNA ligase [Candidatus Kerfeldbacteria bacterium RIFOXYC2_FULL_38_9]